MKTRRLETATERDVLDVAEREDRLCELKDGVLVEKGMGYGESMHENASFHGENILPGFTLSLAELFAELDRHG